MSVFTRTVWVLSIVSLLADIASEMLYPVVPIYLKHIGFSMVLIGVLEGLAEFVVGISKGYFGKRSDALGVRLPFVKWGYFLSSIGKSMLPLFPWVGWIFAARTLDRFGKGVRTAARDALLSAQSDPATKGRVFGFHRSMDTFGAVLGPIVALSFLAYFPEKYAWLFYLSLIPGLIAVGLVFILKEERLPRQPDSGRFLAYLGYWKEAGQSYRWLLGGLLFFALINSSDLFLLLRAKEITGQDTATIKGYILYNLSYALLAYPAGILADRWGPQTMFVTGLFIFALTYAGFAWASTEMHVYGLFLIYGGFAASTEGVAKAWISNLTPKHAMATGIGFYTSFQSIAALLASVLAGLIWNQWGAMPVFLLSGIGAFLAALYIILIRKKFNVG